VFASLAAPVGLHVIAKRSLHHPTNYWAIAFSGLLGVLLAVSELVARYRDAPAKAIMSISATLYAIVNAAAALGAYYLILIFGWKFGVSGTGLEVLQVLVAGLGSAALFRASIFNVSVGGQIIGVGPSAVLNIILTSVDRAVDRKRAVCRAEKIQHLMKDISFDNSAEELLAYCVAAMQNTTCEESRAIKVRISELKGNEGRNISDPIKSYIFGLDLLNLVGDKVLEQVTGQLKSMERARLDDLRRRVLEVLSKAFEMSMDLQILRQQLDLKLVDTIPVLGWLKHEGRITIDGSCGDEQVSLTQKGREWLNKNTSWQPDQNTH
jgi:hypothetical protein